MLMKERFEGSHIALLKLVQDAALTVLHPPFPLLSTLTAQAQERLHAFGGGVRTKAKSRRKSVQKGPFNPARS
jgi:hypothetical protein